jgi:CheY-like chemotaxis protein
MPKKILIVDDESPIAELISDFCAALGFETRVFSGEKDILSEIHAYKPDLITLDLVMPGLSGFEILDLLKKDPEAAKVPVIVVSTIAGNIAAEDVLWSQAKAVLAKPLQMDKLKSSIQEALVP